MSNSALSQCSGKMVFAGKGQALSEIKRRQKVACRRRSHKDRKRDLATLVAYKCQNCQFWHIGNHL